MDNRPQSRPSCMLPTAPSRPQWTHGLDATLPEGTGTANTMVTGTPSGDASADSESADPALGDGAGADINNPTPPADTADVLETCPVMAEGKCWGHNSYRNGHVRSGCGYSIGRGIVPSPRFSPRFLPPPTGGSAPLSNTPKQKAFDSWRRDFFSLRRTSPTWRSCQPPNGTTPPLLSREYYRARVAGFFPLPSKSPATLLTPITLPNSAPLPETT